MSSNRTQQQIENNNRKKKSLNSMILRRMALMCILHNNNNYSFVVSKNSRSYRVGIERFCIEKIIDPTMTVVYERDKHQNNHTQDIEVQKVLIQEMRKNYYDIVESTTTRYSIVKGIREYDGTYCYNFDMTNLEETMGYEFHTTLKSVFEKYKVTLLSDQNTVQMLVDKVFISKEDFAVLTNKSGCSVEFLYSYTISSMVPTI